MTFQFLLNGTPLDAGEAATLIKTVKNSRTAPTIELSEVFDISKLDSKALFEMAVDKGSQELASLAWKISVGKPAKKMKVGRPVVQKTVWEGPEALIEELHKSQSYWAVGAAMILDYFSEINDWSTLRKIAIFYVNDIDASDNKVPHDSVMYKGFTWSEELDMYDPLVLRAGIDRRDTFHVSPMYLSLREGMNWCMKNGLVEQKSQVSYGSLDGAKGNTMQRVYYNLRLTKRGQDVSQLWADSNEYILNFFTARRQGS
jgi:hypothetical protein